MGYMGPVLERLVTYSVCTHLPTPALMCGGGQWRRGVMHSVHVHAIRQYVID